MTALVPPSLSRYIGTAYVDGQAVNVNVNEVWYRYLTQALLQRVGGSEGISTTELQALIAALQAEVDTLQDDLGAVTQGHVIEDEGSAVTQRATINFTGSGVSVADSGGKTVVTISGGGNSYFPSGW